MFSLSSKTSLQHLIKISSLENNQEIQFNKKQDQPHRLLIMLSYLTKVCYQRQGYPEQNKQKKFSRELTLNKVKKRKKLIKPQNLYGLNQEKQCEKKGKIEKIELIYINKINLIYEYIKNEYKNIKKSMAKIDKYIIVNKQVAQDKLQMIDKKEQNQIQENNKQIKNSYRVLNQEIRLTPIKKLKQKCEHMLPERFKIKKCISIKLKDISPVITARLKTTDQNSINFQSSFIKTQKEHRSLGTKNFRLTSRIRQKYKQKFRHLSEQKKRSSSIALPNFDKSKNQIVPSNLLNKNVQFVKSPQRKKKSKSYSESLISIAYQNSLLSSRHTKNNSPAINHMLRMTKIKQMYNMMGEGRKSSKIIQRYNNLAIYSRKLTLGKQQKLSKSSSNSSIRYPCHLYIPKKLKVSQKNINTMRKQNSLKNTSADLGLNRIKSNRMRNLERLQQSLQENYYNQGMITRWQLHNQADRQEGDDQFYTKCKLDETQTQKHEIQNNHYLSQTQYQNQLMRVSKKSPVRRISKSNIIN